VPGEAQAGRAVASRRRTDEFLDVVKLEWSSEQHFSYDGEFYRVADARSALGPPGWR
jgi:alkanesulfonate monooxygenase SsuD/methylene tetrahydromethanopterin reductase-like flavin-dependent oxidoreductase (luciferase family)